VQRKKADKKELVGINASQLATYLDVNIRRFFGVLAVLAVTI
jgi:hypothetical protein